MRKHLTKTLVACPLLVACASPSPQPSTAQGAAESSLVGRWRVVRLDVRGAQGQPDFALVASSKYAPPDGRSQGGTNGMVFIREDSMSYASAWIAGERLDLWWGAGPDGGVLPVFGGWAGEGELDERAGAFRFSDWAGRIQFQQNDDGSVTFPIPWTRTAATIERVGEIEPRTALKETVVILGFDDQKPPAPEPLSRPRATLAWQRRGAPPLLSGDAPLAFQQGAGYPQAQYAIDLAGPPRADALYASGGVRFAIAHVIVYDDVNDDGQLDAELAGVADGKDVVRAISNVSVLWRGSEAGDDHLVDTWPGYQLVVLGPDGRASSGRTPWVPDGYRDLYPKSCGALPADPSSPFPFTVAVQERTVRHALPSWGD